MIINLLNNNPSEMEYRKLFYPFSTGGGDVWTSEGRLLLHGSPKEFPCDTVWLFSPETIDWLLCLP